MWIEPPFWLFVLATVGWGLNMGITTNLAQHIVQSLLPNLILAEFSVFSIGMVGSAPLGAVVLGWLIEAVGTLNALIPAMLLSGILFVYGALFHLCGAIAAISPGGITLGLKKSCRVNFGRWFGIGLKA